MNKIIARCFRNSLLQAQPYIYRNLYQMSFLTDKISEKQSKKQQQQFKKEIQYLANKPTFTYLDYKQRILDEYQKIQNSIRKKMSQEAKEAEKNLFDEKKIMSALFQQQLIGDKNIDESILKDVAVISEVPLEKVKNTFKKAKTYMKMHKFLRNKMLLGQPLPESMAQLQYEFRQSRFRLSAYEKRYQRYKFENKNKGYMRRLRLKELKFKK